MFGHKINKDIFTLSARDLSVGRLTRIKRNGYGKVPCVIEKRQTYFLFTGKIFHRDNTWHTREVDLLQDVTHSEFLSKLKQNLIWMRLDI